ncbi:MAG TPA: Uma2 family endonuclease [Tepidisphaeraceae bacterium]|jgi:Uma2 family endonuclease
MTVVSKPIISSARDVPELHSGDRMTREEFHRIYEQMPENFKAELIGGIVYVASPLKLPHGRNHLPLATLIYLYKAGTPGVDAGDNATVELGDEDEPQPDLFVRILPEYGGQSGTSPDEYVAGAPELIVEIAHSSRSIDLHRKRESYERHGVLEYLVFSIKDRQFRWFDLRGGQELSPDPDGVIRVRTFPGLWIDVAAVLADDATKLVNVLNQGLASPEHVAFVNRLAAARAATK